jgi:hypothetical protein
MRVVENLAGDFRFETSPGGWAGLLAEVAKHPSLYSGLGPHQIADKIIRPHLRIEE